MGDWKEKEFRNGRGICRGEKGERVRGQGEDGGKRGARGERGERVERMEMGERGERGEELVDNKLRQLL